MKTWEKPELIILVRGRLEESVITFCKLLSGMVGQVGDPIGLWPGCYNQLTSCADLCSTFTTS